MGVSLAEIIRARRIVRGMERQDLAAEVGCDVRTVRRWESGCRPLTRYMPALRAALDIPIEEMDQIMLAMLQQKDGQLRIEGPKFLEARGLSCWWLAETLLAMDRRLIGDHPTLGVHEPDQWAEVFESLPDSWRLLTHRGEIVGNWQFVPLAQGLHDEIRDGRLAYRWEQPDASVFVASDVRRLRNGDIQIDGARITGVQVGASSISGIWRLGDWATPMTLSL
ncbi:MAG: helix-turn-helix domain-containing protein [Alkalilacustris sp.]